MKCKQDSCDQMFITLYPTPKPLLPNLFYLPLFSNSFIHLQKIDTHTCTIITETCITRYKYNYGAEIYF